MVILRQPTTTLTMAQRQAITPFQARVYEALLQVEKGQVTTYKELGSAIDCKSSQAIGQALKRNPFAPAVPCHRVVKTDLTLGGFYGTFEKAPKKKSMLEEEGVVFHQNSNSLLYTSEAAAATIRVDIGGGRVI
jgi:methylated-DNA-[protein]-cysteine S-methyltransferase